MLFRLEAIEHHRTGICGEMTLPVPLPVTATTAFLAACLAVSAGFLATSTYTRKEHVSGFLAPVHGVVRIAPGRPGTIVSVAVHEGDLVRAGDTLLTVSAAQANDRGQEVDAAVLADLRRQAATLHDQMRLDQARTEQRLAETAGSIARLQQVISALQAEHDLQLQRSAIALRDLQASAGLLARAEMSPLEGRRRQDAYLAQRQSESAMARTILDRGADLARLRGEAADLVPAGEQRRAVLQGSLDEIEARIAQQDGQRAFRITAPVQGRISALQAWSGKPADPAVPLMSIVPEADALQAHLMVPARASGLIRPGQHVRLSYDAFPYQQYGLAGGTVAAVARTSLKPGEMAGPMEPDAPAYRVTVSLDRQTIHVAGADIPLEPDARLQADILQDTRSLLAWVLDPLRAAGGRR